MPGVLLEANEVCVVCGSLIGKVRVYYPTATVRNRFHYEICASCRQTLDGERRKLRLRVKRGAEILLLYAGAKYLIQQACGLPELNRYVEWIDHFVTNTVSRNEPLGKHWTNLAEAGILEESVASMIACRKLTANQMESVESLRSFCGQVDKAQKERERRARKLYEMRQSGKIGGEKSEPFVFDVLFDVFK